MEDDHSKAPIPSTKPDVRYESTRPERPFVLPPDQQGDTVPVQPVDEPLSLQHLVIHLFLIVFACLSLSLLFVALWHVILYSIAAVLIMLVDFAITEVVSYIRYTYRWWFWGSFVGIAALVWIVAADMGWVEILTGKYPVHIRDSGQGANKGSAKRSSGLEVGDGLYDMGGV